MTKTQVKRWIKRKARRVRRKARRMPKVFARIGKRVAKRQAKKALRRARRAVGFSRRLARSGPKRLVKRWAKRKIRKVSGRKTVGIIRGGQLTKAGKVAFGTATPARKGSGGRHDIVPGRSIVEWRTHPELGRGRVLAFLPDRCLDVEFEAGGRPLNGVPIEEIRLLA